MTERSGASGIWTILAVVIPVIVLAITGAWYAGKWNGADIAQADAFVQFRNETHDELGRIRSDIADIRAVVCATDLKRCRIKSASEESEDTRRASAR